MTPTFPLLVEPMPHHGPAYLYLKKKTHADTWVRGGTAPFFPAKKYLSTERHGISTPDEVTQKAYLGVSRNEVDAHFQNHGHIILIDTVVGDRRVEYGYSAHVDQDALILCLSWEKSSDIMRRLDKSYCVEIANMEYLKRHVDAQIGCKSFLGRVNYTADDNRAHFLKHKADEWQKEVRLVWLIDSPREKLINIPCAIANRVKF